MVDRRTADSARTETGRAVRARPYRPHSFAVEGERAVRPAGRGGWVERSRAGEVVDPLRNKARRLAEVVIASRNYFVHLESRDERVLGPTGLYDAGQLLVLALECNLLSTLGSLLTEP